MSINKEFTGQINQLEPSFGGGWLRSGIKLFVQQRNSWMLLMLLFFVFSLMAITLPILGPLLTKIVAPAFTAGMLACCYKLNANERFRISDVLTAVRERGPQLLRLGLIYTALLLLLSYFLVLFFSNMGGKAFIQSLVSFNQEVLNGNQPDTTSLIMPEFQLLLKTGLFWLLCYLPIMMLMMFSPILVWKYQLGVLDSMRLSFIAIWQNRAAMWSFFMALLVVIAIYVVPLLLIGLLLGSYASNIVPMVGTIIFVISALIIKPIIILAAFEAHKDIFLAGKEYLAA